MGGSVVVLTGAAGVFGQAVALHLGGAGCRLLLVDLMQPDWDGESDAVSIGNVDLTLPEHAQEVVNQALAYFGQIDAVVNMLDESAQGVLRAVNMCQAVLPQFQAQEGGGIVNMGHSMLKVTNALAQENKAEGIRINVVLPSAVEALADPWLSPQAVADAIAFLLSPDAADVHGAGVSVDGRL